MVVTGSVMDPSGKPVPNAAVMVYGRVKLSRSISDFLPAPIGHGVGDSSGRFRVDALRTSSSRHDWVGAVALQSGFGAGWAVLDQDADQPAADITLRPERIIQGRVFDVQGRPVQGVAVMVMAMTDGNFANVARTRENIERFALPFGWRNILPHGWPQPATTDAEGRFTVRGVGRDLLVSVGIGDSRFARLTVPVETRGTPDPQTLTIGVEPAKIITGGITDAETGKPIPGAILGITSYRRGSSLISEFEADAQGRFRVNPLSAERFTVTASAPDGQPHLRVVKHFAWPKGALEHSVDLALPQGIVIRGTVTEEGSGRPVAGARVSFRPGRRARDATTDVAQGSVASGPDGVFQLSVLPGPGTLVVLGPSDDYVLQEASRRTIDPREPGGRVYAHAFVVCELKAGGDGAQVPVVLRRGVTITGRVVGPDGQPVQDTRMFSRVIFGPAYTGWRIWGGGDYGIARNGRFTIHGLDPNAGVSVAFLEPTRKLGVTVDLSGAAVGNGPIIVQLGPCGSAVARLVRPDGKPLLGYRGSGLIAIVVTPGALDPRLAENRDRPIADQAALPVTDPINYKDGPVSGSDGHIVFPALIPGASYRIIDSTTNGDPAGPRLRKEFTVHPGEILDLGEILIEKAPG
jgi:protocatechuate 3,4-dioxygenase beta subunit